MGEEPHEVYTDVEKKARAEKVCGSCKHYHESDGDGKGICKSPNLNPENADWDKPILVAEGHLYPADGFILVSETFGCVHFEPKT